MVKWETFYDLILPEVPGVSTDLVKLHLRQTAIEFFEESGVFNVMLDPISVNANIAEYDLDNPDSTVDIAQIKQVWFGSKKLDPTTFDELGQAPDTWMDRKAEEPTNYTQEAQNTIRLFPTPTKSLRNGLRVRVALRPSLTAAGLEDWVATKYIQELCAGVKAVLMEMSNKPWSNPGDGAKYRALYESAKTRATVDANKSFTRGTRVQVQLKRII